MTTYRCLVDSCAAIGVAEGMWNISRGDTGGKLVVVCPRDAAVARKKGFRVFRLSDTLARDNAREAQRRASMQFFEALKGRKMTERAHRAPLVRVT